MDRSIRSGAERMIAPDRSATGKSSFDFGDRRKWRICHVIDEFTEDFHWAVFRPNSPLVPFMESESFEFALKSYLMSLRAGEFTQERRVMIPRDLWT